MKFKHVFAGILATGTLAGGGSLVADASINPYTSENVVQNGVSVPADVIAASSTLPEAGTDTTVVDTTKPEIELSKWSGQVAMGITYEGLPATTTGARPFLSKDVNWDGASQSMQVVPLAASSTMEDGGMEINIILNSEPATNTFPFAISGASDLDFFYQAPLWEEAGLNAPTSLCSDTVCNTDGQGTSTRPENVVGSYAVYYTDHFDHVQGQTNFATGKAYQIFRPSVTDASGVTIWATLSYSRGLLTLSVPQGFLDSATYPVTVDPTFGYTTAGASSAQVSVNQVVCISKASLISVGSNGTVSDVQMNGNFFAAGAVEKGIVTDSGFAILANGVGPEVTLTATHQWWVSTYVSQPSVASGSSYHPCVIVGGNSTTIFRDSGVSGDSQVQTGNTYSSPTNPTGLANSSFIYSIYADYTAGAAAPRFAPWQFNDF